MREFVELLRYLQNLSESARSTFCAIPIDKVYWNQNLYEFPKCFAINKDFMQLNKPVIRKISD